MSLIKAMLAFGLSVEQAEWVYRAKHLRWFFDRHEGEIERSSNFLEKAYKLMTQYLKKNENSVMDSLKHPNWPDI